LDNDGVESSKKGTPKSDRNAPEKDRRTPQKSSDKSLSRSFRPSFSSAEVQFDDFVSKSDTVSSNEQPSTEEQLIGKEKVILGPDSQEQSTSSSQPLTSQSDQEANPATVDEKMEEFWLKGRTNPDYKIIKTNKTSVELEDDKRETPPRAKATKVHGTASKVPIKEKVILLPESQEQSISSSQPLTSQSDQEANPATLDEETESTVSSNPLLWSMEEFGMKDKTNPDYKIIKTNKTSAELENEASNLNMKENPPSAKVTKVVATSRKVPLKLISYRASKISKSRRKKVSKRENSSEQQLAVSVTTSETYTEERLSYRASSEKQIEKDHEAN
jgi:hypothetical protein